MADLSGIDLNSRTWMGLKARLKELREMESKALETQGMSLEETEGHRGAIRIIDAVLGIGKPKPEFPSSGDLPDSA